MDGSKSRRFLAGDLSFFHPLNHKEGSSFWGRSNERPSLTQEMYFSKDSSVVIVTLNPLKRPYARNDWKMTRHFCLVEKARKISNKPTRKKQKPGDTFGSFLKE